MQMGPLLNIACTFSIAISKRGYEVLGFRSSKPIFLTMVHIVEFERHELSMRCIIISSEHRVALVKDVAGKRGILT